MSPKDLIIKLGWIFPEINFELKYASEDRGYELGHIKFKDTDIDEKDFDFGSKEAKAFASKIINKHRSEEAL